VKDNSWKPDIYQFLDYREYLRAYYEAAKEAVPAFSYRYFSRRAGFSSPNYLKMVMDGDRNLTDDSVKKMVRGLELEGDEARFFADLVDFVQAVDAEKRNEAYERVAASQQFRQARRIDHSMFEYLSRWYLPAIREMAAHEEFTDDPAWIARRLFPSITEEEAAEALELLFEMGLLIRTEDGGVTRGEPTWTTGHEVRSLAIGNFHRQMLQRAAESIEEVPREVRDLSQLTVVIEAETVDDLKERIHAFRESLIERCERDDGREVVYQIGIQLFPLSHWGEP
jgi:uncharacterized protein (TIGR02147 family)